MSKTETKKPAPPHSLALRARQRKMPTTAGVHVLPKPTDAAQERSPAGDEGETDNEISPRLREIHAAVSRVSLDDQALWTKAKGPKVSALEAILGYEITEAERDQAWALETWRN